MKNCPHCGKSNLDDAAKCKYCSWDISTPSVVALTCPTCGASLQYTGAMAPVRCTYCGNSLVVESPSAGRAQPAAPAADQPQVLAETLRVLVELGETQQALDLLCQQFSLPLADAKNVVTQFETGNYGSEGQIIADAVRRAGKR